MTIRSVRFTSLLAAALISTACAGDQLPNDTAAPDAVVSTTTTQPAATTTAQSITTTTLQATTTTSSLPSEPDELAFADEPIDGITLFNDAHRRSFANGPLEVRSSMRSGPLDSAGRLDGGEHLFTANVWDGDSMSGSASFNGTMGTAVRANRNQELAASMLIFGSTYFFDGEWLVGERRLFAGIEGVEAGGGEWVKVKVGRLDTQQLFALRLFAPYNAGRPVEDDGQPVDPDLDHQTELIESRGEWNVYRTEFSAPTVTGELQFSIDGEGRLRESRLISDTFGQTETILSFRPLDVSEVRSVDADAADDITDAFLDYSTERYSSSPESLGG